MKIIDTFLKIRDMYKRIKIHHIVGMIIICGVFGILALQFCQRSSKGPEFEEIYSSDRRLLFPSIYVSNGSKEPGNSLYSITWTEEDKEGVGKTCYCSDVPQLSESIIYDAKKEIPIPSMDKEIGCRESFIWKSEDAGPYEGRLWIVYIEEDDNSRFLKCFTDPCVGLENLPISIQSNNDPSPRIAQITTYYKDKILCVTFLDKYCHYLMFDISGNQNPDDKLDSETNSFPTLDLISNPVFFHFFKQENGSETSLVERYFLAFTYNNTVRVKCGNKINLLQNYINIQLSTRTFDILKDRNDWKTFYLVYMKETEKQDQVFLAEFTYDVKNIEDDTLGTIKTDEMKCIYATRDNEHFIWRLTPETCPKIFQDSEGTIHVIMNVEKEKTYNKPYTLIYGKIPTNHIDWQYLIKIAVTTLGASITFAICYYGKKKKDLIWTVALLSLLWTVISVVVQLLKR
jgi:hypothetical protein